MKTYVLLQMPPDGYTMIAEATIKKHFDLVDRGWIELESGSWDEMHDLQNELEVLNEGIIQLRTSTSLIQCTSDTLSLMLDNDPNYLEDKEFI